MRTNIKKVYKSYIYVYDLGNEKDGSVYSGQRLVLSLASIRGEYMICCPLSTKSRLNRGKKLPTKVLLKKSKVTCLNWDSEVATEHIMTLRKDDRLKSCLGRVPNECMSSVLKAVNKAVGEGYLNPQGVRPKYHRGDLVKYRDENGKIRYGVIVQNNIGNTYSTITVVVEAEPTFGRRKTCDDIVTGRFMLHYKRIHTVPMSSIIETKFRLKDTIMKLLTKSYLSLFQKGYVPNEDYDFTEDNKKDIRTNKVIRNNKATRNVSDTGHGRKMKRPVIPSRRVSNAVSN